VDWSKRPTSSGHMEQRRAQRFAGELADRLRKTGCQLSQASLAHPPGRLGPENDGIRDSGHTRHTVDCLEVKIPLSKSAPSPGIGQVRRQ